MSKWNHRILAHLQDNEVYFIIHEVYYNDDGVPNGYTQEGIEVSSESLKGVKWVLNSMIECTKEPILWYGDKFPKEFKTIYKCVHCGRNNFSKPEPHTCNGNFRKRVKFETIYE